MVSVLEPEDLSSWRRVLISQIGLVHVEALKPANNVGHCQKVSNNVKNVGKISECWENVENVKHL
jgi:hypothetical protein